MMKALGLILCLPALLFADKCRILPEPCPNVEQNVPWVKKRPAPTPSHAQEEGSQAAPEPTAEPIRQPAQESVPQTPQETNPIPPSQIEAELDDAEAQYEHALTLFNPWYTGPLITPSATMVPPGQAMLQPYIYFTDNYGRYDSHRNLTSSPNRFYINPQPILIQIGVTPSVDATLVIGTIAQWQQSQFSGGFQDTTLQIGFQICEQTPWVPKAKFSIAQSLPTGKYQNLNPDKLSLDSTGAGAWQTSFVLSFGKVILWDTQHPMNTRLSFNYTASTPVKVNNFNNYGGGYGTRATVYPGSTFKADLGLEVSVTEPWVVALDIVYNCTNITKYAGFPGVTTNGGTVLASMGSGFNDQLSLAPAVEYNFNANMGVLGGAWFTIYGRNASSFVSGIFSWYWQFP